MSTAILAARASGSASRPKICTPKRRPSSDGVILSIAFFAPSTSACAERNSVMVMPTPISSHHGAERQIGDGRHRRQQDIRLDGEVSDAHSGVSIAYQGA